MKFLILGAGAIGGYFGGRLAESGADVTFLVRPGRRAQLERDGLRIESALGNVSRPVQIALADSLVPDYDVVLLTCKAYDLQSSIEAIAPAVGPHTAIIPLLNGLAHFAVLDTCFGSARVMGGTCMIDSILGRDGVVRHGGTLQRLVFGERDGRRSPRAAAVAAALAGTTIDGSLSDDIERVLWEKLMFLAALASLTCLFRANVGEIISAPGGREAMERALAANAETAMREGHPPSAAGLDFARTRLTDPTGTWSASMLRDLESGGRVEADHIVGWMLDRARRHGVDDTLLSLAFTHLKAFEARRDANRLPDRAGRVGV
jgi:2-dehydropantoate 2-reductase